MFYLAGTNFGKYLLFLFSTFLIFEQLKLLVLYSYILQFNDNKTD